MSSSVVGENRGDQRFPTDFFAFETQRTCGNYWSGPWAIVRCRKAAAAEEEAFLPVECAQVDSKSNNFERRDSASFSAPAVSGDVDTSVEEFNNGGDELRR